ncbi:MAG: trigger factor [bacterium]
MKILEQRDTGTCKKTLKIEIPREEVGTELNELYKEFMENATVPGFRKGKAPRRIVQMKYGKHLGDEAIGKAVETAFKHAVDELQLKPVNTPEIGGIEKEKEEEPVVFEATFEYAPRLEDVDYRDIRPEVPPQEVTETEVVENLNRLRENNAVYRTIEDRPVADGDLVSIASVATIGGDPFPEATNSDITVEVGTKRYIPGFEEALTGMSLGEEKTITLTLPEDYPQEDKRGKEAVFQIKVRLIREKKLPEPDDEFAKDLGNFNSLHELKERIRTDLSRNREQYRRNQLRGAIRQELIRRNPFDVPPSLVSARYNFINALHDMELKRLGTTLEREARRDEGLLARNEKAAEEEVRITLLLEAIAKKEDLELTDEDYYVYLNRISHDSGHDLAWYAKRVETMGMESYYRRVALEEKVMDLLQARAESESAGDAAPEHSGEAGAGEAETEEK